MKDLQSGKEDFSGYLEKENFVEYLWIYREKKIL